MIEASNSKLFSKNEIGLGTWSWGDKLVWGYGNKYSGKEVSEAFQEAVSLGIRFFDTAEIYGQGKSELFLGRLLPTVQEKMIVATKMMPFPWRLGKSALRKALTASLKRLGLASVDLYQMHWPMPPVKVENWMQQMKDVFTDGLIQAVGVSNYDLELTKRSCGALEKNGISLASNQVEYHLLERRIEKNGLLEYCRINGIKVIAYSPLAMGILTGKYSPENPPRGARASQYNRAYLERIQPILKLTKKIGADHEGKTASQVALNWVIAKGAFPIPGAKNADQVAQNAGAMGWKLTDEEINKLDEASDQIRN